MANNNHLNKTTLFIAKAVIVTIFALVMFILVNERYKGNKVIISKPGLNFNK